MALRIRDLILCCLLLCAANAYTQELPDGWRSYEFKVFALDRKPIEEIYFDDDGLEKLMEFKKKRRSDVYEYRGPETITFFCKGVDDLGVPIRIPVGSCVVPANIRQPLFFFLPTKQHATEYPDYNITVIDDSLSAFPFGDLIVFNASGAELAAKIGDNTLMLPFGPSQSWSMRKLFREANNNSWVDLFFAAEIAPDEYELVYRNTVQFSDEGRSILVLRPPRRPRSIKIETYLIEEYPPDPVIETP